MEGPWSWDRRTTVLLEDLPESLLEQNPPAEITEGKYHASVKELKKQLILNAVEQTRGNYVEAAAIMGASELLASIHSESANQGEVQQALRGRGKMGGAA